MRYAIGVSHKLFGFIPRKTVEEPGKALERIENDAFLNHIYKFQTNRIKEIHKTSYKGPAKSIIEIGAAGGITKTIWPEVLTTDVRISPGVDIEMQAEKIIAENSSVSLIFGLDALHHVRNPEKHFEEVDRSLVKGGQAIYIEPNWNLFSILCFKYLLKYLHPEPYDNKVNDWKIDNPDPMMGNQAQAHNIFVRDKRLFEDKFPNLQIELLEGLKGISFLFSGGVHTRLPIPGKLLIKFFDLETSNNKWMKFFSLGRIIVLNKLW